MWEGLKKTLSDTKNDIKSTIVAEKKTILQKLKSRQWSSSSELEQLLEKLQGVPDLTIDDILWMLLDQERLRQFAVSSIGRIQDPNKINKLILFAKDRQEKPRRFILQIVEKLCGSNLPRYLRTWATQKEEYYRHVAVDLLPGVERSVAFPVASLLLRDQLSTIRLKALNYLVSTGDSQALWNCTVLLQDPEEEIRYRTLTALTGLNDDRLVPVLLRVIRSETSRIQEAAIGALVAQVKTNPEKYEDEILSLLSDSNPILRKIPTQLLTQSDPVRIMRKFLLLFRDSFGWIRERAVRSLKEAPVQFTQGIVALMEDADPQIRSLAENIAMTLEDSRVVPFLIRMLQSDDWWKRYCAAETLARLKDPRAFPILVQMLTSPENRLFAIEALSILKDPRSIEILGKLLPIASPEEKLEIVEAFRRMAHSAALPYLKEIVESSSDFLRSKVENAIQEISGIAAPEKEIKPAQGTEKVDLSTVPVVRIHHFLQQAVALGASDFHLAVGHRPTYRIQGRLTPADYPPLTASDSMRLLVEILDENQLKQISSKKNIDFCFKLPELGRFRTNVFVQRNGMDASFRIIPKGIPTWDELGLPSSLKDLTQYHQGMVLVTGPSGCGKTTTLAALVDLINESKSCHIITIEDPIEYVHPHKTALVTQREIGTHTESFSTALRAALREDPDVILVGEMRDLETVQMAITAAETGHLVLSTLHTTSAASSIDRIVSSFPPGEQWQIRTMLSESLKAIITQVLLPNPDQSKLVPAFEILIVNPAIAALIREGKTFQIPSMQQTGGTSGMCLMDQSLLKLVQEKKVDPGAAYARAFKKELVEPFLTAN